MDRSADFMLRLRDCVKCGKCLSRCPIYRETRDETEIARGKIAILQSLEDGSLAINSGIRHAAENCLFCLNCQAACPNDMPMDRIIPALRAKAAKSSKGALISRDLMDKLPGEPLRFAQLAGSARPLSRLLTRREPGNRGISLRVGLPGLPRQRVLPAFARTPLLETMARKISGLPAMPTVAIFTGCLHNLLEVTTGYSLINVLHAMGFNLLIPEEQSCCGLPFHAMGLEQAGVRHAEINIDTFTSLGADMIVSGCPSCVSHLRHCYSDISQKGTFIARTVMPVQQLIWDYRQHMHIDRDKAQRYRDIAVTWHDPCHLARGLSVSSQPRKLLEMLHADRFYEMTDADRCCGGGGSYSLTHYQTARAIGQRKLEAIQTWIDDTSSNDCSRVGCPAPSPRSHRLITSCPGCMVQLNDLVAQSSLPVSVVDLIDHIAAVISSPIS